MTFPFVPAVRENVGLILGIVGPSGGGKTFTAMELATGMGGGKPFAVVDTERGRAKHYADRFRFDHGDLRPPFSPARYAEAIQAADAAGYPVIVVDSASHEHAGEGGLLDMQEDEFERLGRREAAKMASWIRPKGEHKRFVQQLLQVRAHLILCFRAEQKVEMKREGDKTIVVPKMLLSGFSEWIPVAEKSLLYEFTASFLFTPDRPGYPKPIKLQEQHRPFFPLDQSVTRESGKRLAEWAKGGSTVAGTAPSRPEPAPSPLSAPHPGGELFSQGDSRDVRMPNGEPIAIVDRQVLIGKITGLADKLQLSPTDRKALAKKHVGAGSLHDADPAALQDLLTELRQRAGASAA